MNDFKKLMVWQKAMDVVDGVFALIRIMDRKLEFILASLMGRSAISIPSNIVEGAGRKNQKEFSHFLDIALGSSFELETQIRICGYIKN